MIPVLPAAEVRAAIAVEDWDRAASLLQDHGEAVAAALATVDFERTPRQAWVELLDAQHALTEEIRLARDEVMRAIDKLGQDQRGARAWAQALA
ncbi:hypothetical protein [uncultured Luteimonas sp.]|uniref:hypothetical protein n=1 Tax=uncultured Luteimonas sp. TaxID=453144 RepID=UPI00261E570B|nr:hypothetical protein [uncultured Luteimonas sp.]